MSNLSATDLFSVNGLVAVITGASSGLGETMAHALDINGASKVFILGRRESKLQEVASRAKNGSLIPIPCDTSSKPSLQLAASQIQSQTPFINLLIANAGYLGDEPTGLEPRPADQAIAALQSSLWDSTSSASAAQILNTNVAGTYFTFLAFLNLLAAGNTHPARNCSLLGQSQFIATTSMGGLRRAEGPGYVYNASKAGLNHLTKTLSSEYARFGIRANAIAHGTFVTEMTEAYVPRDKDLTLPGSIPWTSIPATRTGTEEDIAGALLYLSSRAGSFVNGSVLLVDGGAVSVSPGSY